MRVLVLLLLSVVSSFAVFWLMHWMITPEQLSSSQKETIAMVNFVRSLDDSEAQRKNRDISEPPKPKPTPKLNTPVAQTTTQSPDVSMPNLDASLSSFKGQGIGSMLSGYGFGNTDVIPLVRVNPRYPQSALARRIEGYVIIRMSINEAGNVDDVEVVESDPKGVFEREAIRAAWRFKFKPKLEDGKPVSQTAVLPFEFNLEERK
ncbi:energy transducer TonB [Bermanella marisrubri]|uniref:Protein TonB n=1 Tax=Bermanella marisrubri TaxID=207949 RepID=Q1N4L3_9GAMM|nr:energy transducer TonB [Bermanella marisrubri]EAT13415.1 tonB2 protein [Oceanobacter sp. RED65] [Bermanella marisrubri]QIZ84165.1 energy transducer TonB [Bermanella marisrubri]